MGRPAITADEAEFELRRSLKATLGTERTEALTVEIRTTAEALALVLNEPIELHDVDPDFARPPA